MRVTTIIVTRGRVGLLARAIRSLSQQISAIIDLRLVIDDCHATRTYLERHSEKTGAIHSVSWQYLSRSKSDRSGPKRVAMLREVGLSGVQSHFCAFLDDDNELESHHYALLERSITQARAVAAHSWRTLWSPNGTPFPLIDRHPWSRDVRVAQQMFNSYRDAGIYQLNSAVVRDQVAPHCRAESMVDTSEWLFTTSFLRGIRFATHYTHDDWLLSRTEDNKLLDSIVETGAHIPSSRTPTLRYYLGGYSNEWTQEGAHIDGWVDCG